MRKLVALFALSAVTAFVGACRRPAGGAAPAGEAVVVRVDEDGTTWLVTDPRAAGGADIKTDTTTDVKTDIEGLETFLVKTAKASPGDDDGLPTTHVRIDAHPACDYECVQEVMVACIKARIWRITFGMGDAELPADLPKDDGGAAGAPVEPARTEPPPRGPGLQQAPSSRRPPPPAARRRPWTTEMRVRLYWVNARGQVIHSPERAFPDDWEERSGGVRVALSTDGAHLEIMVSQVRVAGVKVYADDPDVVAPDELARMLDEVAVGDPDMPVVIDARRKVPFSFVFGVLDACRRAKVKKVFFDAPPDP